MNSNQRIRARAFLALIIIAAAGLAASLYRIQVMKGSTYVAQANKQYDRPQQTIFDRGTIFFSERNGTHSAAATVQSGYVIYMNPTLIKNAAEAYSAISQYLKIDRDDFMKKAALTTDPYEELAHHVGESSAQSIKGISIAGIGVTKESWRTYPGNRLASHELGIVGQDNSGSILGRYGLERSYETVLAREGIGSSVAVFAQIFTGIKESVFGSEASTQGDIVTSIEPTVAGQLEKTLEKAAAAWHPDEIGGIIMDPKTGEIIAMSSLPTFNGNNLTDVKNPSVFSNPLVEHVYEMGSIMKPITVATGLDSESITTKFTYDDTGSLTLSGKTISNYDKVARGPGTTLQTILNQSLNVGAATIALKTGKESFAKYFKSFGLAEKSGIDQPNEAASQTSGLNTGRDIEIATMAYGQGIAVSPIVMARALSVLANGGYLIKPHLVKEIDYTDGTVKKIDRASLEDPTKNSQVLKKETVDSVTNMLVTAFDTSLRNGIFKIPNYSVAAKTGTAQIPDPANKGYYADRYLHSFFGYFPAHDPKFIVFLYQVYPRGAPYASDTLSDPFSEITKFLISYYNIPPDR